MNLKSLNIFQKRQSSLNRNIYKELKKTHLKMSLNKKHLTYYCLVSVSKGLNTDLPTSKLMLGQYEKDIYQECSHCKCISEFGKAFTENEFICNMCLKLLEKNDETSSKIYIIWKDNLKFRVFSILYRSFLDKIFRNKNIKDKIGEISKETIAMYLNSSI